MTGSSLGPIIVSVATALGLSEILKLLVTRASRRTTDAKVQVDAASVISTELRQWTTQAETRARAAEARADKAEERTAQTEARLQARIDVLMAELDGAEEKVESAVRAFTRLEARINACQAGAVCPVRTADTDPGMGPIDPSAPPPA